MKLRGLIIAVVVLLGLGGLLYWSNHHKPSGQDSVSASATTSILRVDPSSISRLTLRRRGAEPVTLARSDAEHWQIASSQGLRADDAAVSGVVSALSSLNADRVVEEKAADLKPYGLDDPSIQVEIESKGHGPRRLLVGDDTPAGNNAYAMLAGDPRIFTIPGFTRTGFDKGLSDLRDRRLLTVEPDKVSQVVVDRKPQAIAFTRARDGWQIQRPSPSRADSFQVDELVRTVTEARMNLASGDAPTAGAFAQAAPVAAVTLTGDQGPQTVTIRKDKNDYLARSSAVDGIYRVDESLATALNKNFDDFRNKKLFDFGFADPEKIELRRGGSSWNFSRSGDDWWSNGRKMDKGAVASLVDRLRDLSATSFPASGFGSADVEVTVTSENGKRIERAEISSSSGASIARRESEPALYQLDSTAVANLVAAAGAVKPAATPAR